MAAGFACCLAPASAHAAGGVYVALGDSYTSGPLVPNQYGQPIDCGRSDHNYPSLVAGNFRPGTFVDVSCGSAETKHMAQPQTDLPAGGTNPPQFNGLRRDATYRITATPTTHGATGRSRSASYRVLPRRR